MTLHEAFDRFWPQLEAAVQAFGDTHHKHHVLGAIERGDCQFWANETGALVTEITVYPTGLRVINAWLAGGELDGILALVPQIEAWARGKGITRASVASGRAGWSRKLPGYRMSGVQMTKDL